MERRFTLKDNDLRIPCVLEEPEYCTVRRCIIGVHGFCGNKDSKILVDIAEEMGLFGAATVRFDFPAHGDSPVTDWELSLQRCQDTLTAVVRWAKRAYPYVDTVVNVCSNIQKYSSTVLCPVPSEIGVGDYAECS